MWCNETAVPLTYIDNFFLLSFDDLWQYLIQTHSTKLIIWLVRLPPEQADCIVNEYLSRSGNVYIRQWIESSLVKVMAAQCQVIPWFNVDCLQITPFGKNTRILSQGYEFENVVGEMKAILFEHQYIFQAPNAQQRK